MSNKKIRKLLIESKGYKCEECAIESWNNKPICLEVDHIDGNNKNNDLLNLRFLCPNCHSQTNNFRGRNIAKKAKITDEQMYEALTSTPNIRQALLKLGLTPKGENYIRAYTLLNGSYHKNIDINNSQYNTCWINNGTLNKKIKSTELDTYKSLGWVLGRLMHLNSKLPSNKGKFWVTNGNTNMITDHIPEGFWRGKIQR